MESRQSRTRSVFAVAAFAVLVWLACALGSSPATALAKSYECVGVDIQAAVGADGSLSVTEARTFEFDGDFTLVGVVLDPPDQGKLEVTGVRATNSVGTATKLREVPFEKSWRSAGGPGKGYYAVDEARDTVYCFSEYWDEHTVTVDYTYTNAVKVHRDVAELYWQFVGTEWEVDPGDVEMRLTLPVPAGEAVRKGDNVRAWGHGSLSGVVEFDEDGSILYTAPDAQSGEFVEARVTFPPAWVPSVSKSVVGSGAALDSILAEEQEWADKANAARMRARVLSGIPGGISLVLIIAALVVFFRRGKEYKPQFREDYWRDVPAPGVEPAVVGRIYRFGDESSDDITATLMHLHAIGAIKLERFTYEKHKGIMPKTEEDYRIVARLDASRKPLSDIDRATTKLFFDQFGKHSDSVTLGEVKRQAKSGSSTFVKRIESWQKKVTTDVSKGKYFEEGGQAASTLFELLAGVYAALGIGGLFMFDFPGGMLPVGLVAIGALVTFIIAMQMPRRSHEANDIKARCDALKRWFKDFTNLKEAIPTDVNVWGELLVYAYLLGVSKEVVEQLRIHVPQLWNDDFWVGYSTWYWTSDGDGKPACDMVGPTLSEAIATAREAVSSSSSGGGGGGGFSSGGGGGFGGGGGGFAR